MPEFVQNADDIRANLRTMRDYLISENEDERSFAREKLRRGHNFVGGWIDGDVIFAPSRVVGYKGISFAMHRRLETANELDGRHTDPAITHVLGARTTPEINGWQAVEELYLRLCEKAGVTPDRRDRQFWLLDELHKDRQTPHVTYAEGALTFFVSTRYERNAAARQACIDAHGLSCVVCGFNFEHVYGERGKDFIHVHHLLPLSAVREGVATDPKRDLVPVCPNCHYMLHRGDDLLSPEELRNLLRRNRRKR